ncbi:type IV pilus modification protein PilV [Variovorax ureilyticus]|uniref:type IV pilus modification protein PilV n=1 Tax=Variovorax ureilyticus TaxID=1836198 RepID=UPI003D665A6B
MASIKRPAAGFSLLEVLVSIIVFSLGLLGAVGMLMTSVRGTTESGSFTSAVNLVRELSEKARINKNVSSRNGEANLYLLADLKSRDALPKRGDSCVGFDAGCSQAELASWDLYQWVLRARNTLPDVRIAVCFDDEVVSGERESTWDCTLAGRNLVVKLGWKPHGGSSDEASGDKEPPRVVMQLVPGHDDDGSGGN